MCTVDLVFEVCLSSLGFVTFVTFVTFALQNRCTHKLHLGLLFLLVFSLLVGKHLC